MNKTEEAYADRLDLGIQLGEIIDWRFEPLNFRLAKNTYYRPDFLVIKENQFEIHEVKGFWREDARVKIKVAAQQYPWFKWVAVKREKNNWIFEEF